ncbi:MAG: DUF2071 domain-containing protein [Taibaiella sp.]|nr:DUF2071 domain-containing protein [Taibaiella sp.]
MNLRTYVTDGERRGIYFLSIEAGKLLSAYLSRRFSGLPYEKSKMQRKDGPHHSYKSVNPRTLNFLDAEFKPGVKLSTKTELDKWLTERYYLFMNGKTSPPFIPFIIPNGSCII